MIVPESVKKDWWVPPVDELTNIKTQLDEERTLHETTRTQLRNTQTELEVAKIKLLNIEARMSILETNFSKVNV
tara:strand:+ start:1135 stop:1356 length:222 start_codon:yes stop_codon:yes gene_type:complete